YRALAKQIKNHEMDKRYIAVVSGNIKENKGRIEAPVGRSKSERKKMAVVADGREAVTEYEVVRRMGHATVVRIHLLTGRTHQIRVHFAYIHHPVLGDTVYSSGKNRYGFTSQALHAESLSFEHPRTGEYMTFVSPPPPEMQRVLEETSGGS
ncbi:MAG: RluA family pseudouridine synthase, partial [Syntrophomonadaceae bacterium]|nr:RluA family pseudouridine synthase [Syntrophomonadaceae bacterium]